MTVVMNELAKIRHLRIGVIAIIYLVAVVGLTAFQSLVAGIEEMRGLLRHLAVNGVTVMVSSHLLGEIDKIATQLGILAQGRMIFQGTRAELMKASSPDVLITCSEPHRAQNLLVPYNPRLKSSGDLALAGTDDKRTAGFVASLVHEGIDTYGVRRDEQSLEDVFMRLTEGGGL